MRAVELAIEITSDAATDGFSEVGRAAQTMAADVAAASSDASSRIDAIGNSADQLDDKAGRATGALGALSSGFELVGAEKYAGALQAAALATDFASGAGQAFNLILELESVKRAKAIASAAAHKAATIGGSVATKAAAASQWALNAAMSANPIGIVVVAIAALAAGFVVAYKKSETFRDIVDAAMKWVKKAIDPVIAILKTVGEWLGDTLPPLWTKLKDAAVTAFDLILAPVNRVKDAISWIVNNVSKVTSLDWIPGMGGGGMSAGGGVTLPSVDQLAAPAPAAAPVYTGPAIVVNVDGSGIVDPQAVGRALETVLHQYVSRLGRPLVIS